MGTGDRKAPYQPKHPHIPDAVSGRAFAECAMRSCPHPAVIRRFGTGGEAMVSIYTCKKCKHHTEYQFHGGIGCSYAVEPSIQERAEG